MTLTELRTEYRRLRERLALLSRMAERAEDYQDWREYDEARFDLALEAQDLLDVAMDLLTPREVAS